MQQGYVKLYRQMQDNELWTTEKFTDGQAWIDMIMLANHKKGHIKKRGIRLTINRGELGHSELELSKRWKWSRGKVRRFLSFLDAENMIKMVRQTVQQNRKLTTHIQIVNYEEYQGDSTTDDTTNGHQTDIKRYRNKNDKKNKNEKKTTKHIYGVYKHVKLTDEEIEKLKQKLNGDHLAWITKLDEGIEQHGYKYKNHYLTILKWNKKDSSKPVQQDGIKKWLENTTQ